MRNYMHKVPECHRCHRSQFVNEHIWRFQSFKLATAIVVTEVAVCLLATGLLSLKAKGRRFLVWSEV